jgi:hypothetical protein
MARVISQAVDELENIFLLKDDGILEKRTSSNSLIWSQQTKQEPTVGTFVFANAIALDIDNDVWLTYSDTLNIIIRAATTGLVVGEVVGSASNVIVAGTGGAFMYAFSVSRGLLYEMRQPEKDLARSFDMAVQIPNFRVGTFMTQMAASLGRNIYFGALVGPLEEVPVAGVIKFDPAGNGTFTCPPLTAIDVPIQAVSADIVGNIYAANLHGSVFRLIESTQVYDAMFDPVAPCGVINIVTFTNFNELILIDDGTFAKAGGKTRIVNPANGNILSSTASSNVGTVQGDPLGYHHIKLTRIDVPPSPIVPTVDVNKLDVFVKPDGTITATGRPGAVINADNVTLSLDLGPVVIGSTAPNSDGSFSITSAPGAANPSGEATTLAFVKGVQQVVSGITSVPRALPTGFTVSFRVPDLMYANTTARLKAEIRDSGGFIVTPGAGIIPIFRLKEDATSKFFSGTIFVGDDGDYLQGSFDVDSELWFVDIAIPQVVTTSLTLIIKDSPGFTAAIYIGPEIVSKQEIADCVVLAIEDKVSVVLSAPAGAFTDPETIGGFLFEKLVDIQKTSRRLLTGIQGAKNVVIESITVDVDRQAVPKGSTPSIDIFVFDADRRFPLDISGGTVELKAKVNLASGLLKIDSDAEIIDALNGHARAKLTATETDTAQRLTAQVVVSIPGTGTLVSPAFPFDVLESVL